VPIKDMYPRIPRDPPSTLWEQMGYGVHWVNQPIITFNGATKAMILTDS